MHARRLRPFLKAGTTKPSFIDGSYGDKSNGKMIEVLALVAARPNWPIMVPFVILLGTIALAPLLVVAAGWSYHRSLGRRRIDRLASLKLRPFSRLGGRSQAGRPFCKAAPGRPLGHLTARARSCAWAAMCRLTPETRLVRRQRRPWGLFAPHAPARHWHRAIPRAPSGAL